MIPSEYLKRIRQIEIRTWHLAEEYLAGAYRSVFKGRGMDFEAVRAYSVGDDVRFIDWNVTARMDAPYVKEFREERELGVLLAVDVSTSGELISGQQSKRELAAEVAACLAFSAVSNGDKVGLVLFSDRIERYLPPRKGRSQALRIIREVLYAKPAARGTSLERAFDFLNQVQKRRAIAFVLSDFLDEGYERVLKVCAQHHDLIPIVLRDPREEVLPDVGWIVVQDAESGEWMEVNTGNKRLRTLFNERSKERHQRLRRQFRRLGTDVIELTTDAPYLLALQRYMDRRSRQRAQ
jgi:uncharacterized protein (DUF58 family)